MDTATIPKHTTALVAKASRRGHSTAVASRASPAMAARENAVANVRSAAGSSDVRSQG